MFQVIEMEVVYPSREKKIPAILTFPVGVENVPLVIMCHGHGGEKNEHGGFTRVAKDLAKAGIASFRMDFPGSGESYEEFDHNCLTNMKIDVLAALHYVINNFKINRRHIGLLGYSMGGRVCLELVNDRIYDFESVCLIAPAYNTDDIQALFEPKGFDVLHKEACNSPYGWTMFKDSTGRYFKLSTKFFEDIQQYPKNRLLTSAMKSYKNPMHVIYAVDDHVILPKHSKEVAQAFDASTTIVPRDGHNYGFGCVDQELNNLVQHAIVDFFSKTLK